jgi:ribose-phosphate pyrophosphokinase
MSEANGTRGMKLLAGNSNRPLAEAITQHLKLPFTKALVRRFADMEVFVEVQENVRGEDMFVLQSTSYPANDNLMELLVIIDALRTRSDGRARGASPRSFPISAMRVRTAK